MRARFEQESAILGRLRHPGIAHIYQSGVIEGGDGEPVPYFAVELVDGVPVTRYAEDQGLDLSDRLRLLAKICDAVEHAHGHGVIHRDLKPDNILVNDRCEPRVLDFGVARVVDQGMTAHSMATATGLLIGTLAYMSPEQVGARPDEIDGRSDVYALGILSYEILSGRLPLDVTTVSIPEAARRIREVDPPHLGTLDRKFRGDVGTIVEKALEKDPHRRYASAADLARDLRRHLADEPILAKPPSGFYQLSKFAKRNKAIVAGVLVAFLALAAGAIVATRQAVIAQRERAHAVELRERAEHQAYRARIAAAATAVETHDTVLARAHLEAVPDGFRGWEWRHLSSRLDQSTIEIPAGTGRHIDVRFAAGGDRVLVSDRSTVPWVVFSIPLSGTTRPGERYPAGMSRPQPIPPVLREQAIGILHFVRGETGVELLDPDGGQTLALRRCDDATESATVIARAADGRRAILRWAGDEPSVRRVQLCDLHTGVGEAVFDTPYAWAVALSGDGSTLALSPKTIRDVNSVEVFRTRDGVHLRRLPVALDDVTALTLSHDGRHLVAGSYNGVLRSWDVETGKQLAERRAHAGQSIQAVRLCPGETRIASAAADRTVHLWPPDLSGDPVVLHGHDHYVESVGFSGSGDRLVSADRGGTIRLWDLIGNLEEPEVLRGHTSYVNPVCYSPDGTMIASGSWDGTVRLWDAATGAPLRTLTPGSGVRAEFGVIGLDVDRDGSRMAAATTLGGVSVYDLATGRVVVSSDLETRLSRIAFSPDGDVLFAGTSWEELLLLDARTLAVVGREPYGQPFGWSRDGSRLVVRDSEESLVVREGAKGPVVARLEPADPDVTVASWSPDGSRIVTASATGDVRVWDAGTGDPLGPLGTHTGQVHAVAIHPDGTRVAVAGADGVIRLYDLATREELVQLRGHGAYVFDVAWSPDGETLVSGSGDGTVRLWRTTPRRERPR
jgi:WD40 repeat protein